MELAHVTLESPNVQRKSYLRDFFVTFLSPLLTRQLPVQYIQTGPICSHHHACRRWQVISRQTADYEVKWLISKLIPTIRHQVSTWSNANVLPLGPLKAQFKELRNNRKWFPFMKELRRKIPTAIYRIFCSGQNIFTWLTLIGKYHEN